MRWPILLTNLILGVSCATRAPAPQGLTEAQITRVEANPAKGFHWPYYSFVPEDLKSSSGEVHSILVLPNNSGSNDDFAHHEKDASERTERARKLARRIGAVILRPVFPRTRSENKFYTHALDRDTIFHAQGTIRRIDLQLIAMIDHLRETSAKQGLPLNEKVILWGYSASGMFANRFAVLHPDRVAAAAIGSPGGWPIAPLRNFRGKRLRYPVGVADLKDVGIQFQEESYRKIPLFFYQGDKDENDSVAFNDGYDEIDREIVNKLFGETLNSRWRISREIHEDFDCNCTFKLYPGVGHDQPPDVLDDVVVFLKDQIRK